MKPTKRYLVNPDKIHSLKDIELEKQRLRLEILKTEVNINQSYHDVVHAFSLRNIATSVVNEISTTSNVIGKAFSIGKAFIEKRKKKKKRAEQQLQQ